MEKTNQSANEARKEILEMCKTDRQFAEQLYSELYIYLNYNEQLIGVDAQTCEAKPVEEKPSWTQNFLYRIRQALRTKGIEVEFDASEVIDLIREGSEAHGYSFQTT